MSEGEKIEEPSGSGEELAVGLALDKSRRRRASRSGAPTAEDVFLATESRKLEVEIHHLRLGHFDKLLTVGLKLLTILVGVTFAASLGVMAWQAHEDHGLTIAAFSVPPDLAQRGLTGQVVAARVLDRLSELQAQTVSARPASTYADNWGDDIKVEIPETGVSIGELNAYLRQWLGHETRITGEVVRTPVGLSVTARAGADPGTTVQGGEGDVDPMVAQAAEALYARTQPYRWAVYLSSHGRPEEALAIYQRLAASAAPDERAWAYSGWAALLYAGGDSRGAESKAAAAIRLNPRLEPPRVTWGIVQNQLSHVEANRAGALGEIALLRSGKAIGVQREDVSRRIKVLQAVAAGALGDHLGSARLFGEGAVRIDFEGRAAGFDPRLFMAASLAQAHDVTGARRVTAAVLQERPATPADNLVLGLGAALQAVALDDWQAAASLYAAMQSGDGRGPSVAAGQGRSLARLGRYTEALAAIADTPLDCYDCITVRGVIAAQQRDWANADRWFAEAARRDPAIPDVFVDWAEALLARGDMDGAIAKLKEAHRRGPHFADPLELWGEALMRKGDYAGAVAKFREADKNAPRWGRNHMRWGQALMKLGKTAEAKAQFAAAAGMDLSVADRAELTRLAAALA